MPLNEKGITPDELRISPLGSALVTWAQRNIPTGRISRSSLSSREDAAGDQDMRDIVIGICFLAMLLSPAVVASFQKGRTDDEA